jgi:hypothetical protein
LYQENYIKGWRLTKYNKDGLKQERYLILTDTCYYTVKYDITKKIHDTKHTKRHPLNDLNSIDLGTFQNTNQPVLYVVANERVSHVKREEKDLQNLQRFSSSPNVETMGGSLTQRARSSSMVGLHGGFYANIFVWERSNGNLDTMTSTDIKRAEFTLKEIAFSLYGASNYSTRGLPPNLQEKQSFQKVML